MNEPGQSPDAEGGQGQDYGAQYLEQISQDFLTAREALPKLGDAEFNRVAQNPNQVTDVGSFLRHVAVGDEASRRRWQNQEIPTAMPEHEALIKAALPMYTEPNPQLLGDMVVEPAAKYRLDTAVEDVVGKLKARLPYPLAEHQYDEYGEATDTVHVDGVGDVKVDVKEAGLRGMPWIWRTVRGVETDQFVIRNTRGSGVGYGSSLADISRTHDIEIKPIGLKATLGETGGISVTHQGEQWENQGVYTKETGWYYPEETRNVLRRVKPQDPLKLRDFQARGEDKRLANWEQFEDQAIKWMGENVAKPLSNNAPQPPAAPPSTTQ